MENREHPRRVAIHHTRPHLVIPYDGFTWLKYGQKQLNRTQLTRAYFKCAQHRTDCRAKKWVDFDRTRSNEKPAITYTGEHNHSVPGPDSDAALYNSILEQETRQQATSCGSIAQGGAGGGDQSVDSIPDPNKLGDTAMAGPGTADAGQAQGAPQSTVGEETDPSIKQVKKRIKRDFHVDPGSASFNSSSEQAGRWFQNESGRWVGQPGVANNEHLPWNDAPSAGPALPLAPQATAQQEQTLRSPPHAQEHVPEPIGYHPFGLTASGSSISGTGYGPALGDRQFQNTSGAIQLSQVSQPPGYTELPSSRVWGFESNQGNMLYHLQDSSTNSQMLQPEFQPMPFHGRLSPSGPPTNGRNTGTLPQGFPAPHPPPQNQPSQQHAQGFCHAPRARFQAAATHQFAQVHVHQSQSHNLPCAPQPTAGFQRSYSNTLQVAYSREGEIQGMSGMSSASAFQQGVSIGNFMPTQITLTRNSFQQPPSVGNPPTGSTCNQVFLPHYSSSESEPKGSLQGHNL